MKKLGKLLLGVTALTAVAGGAYLIYKKVKEFKDLDLEDFDLEEDFFDEDLESEISKELHSKSTDERDYINISVEAPVEESEKTEEMSVEEKMASIPIPTPTVTPVSTETV